jgi:transcriptional regulator with XRE-family HTH domain
MVFDYSKLRGKIKEVFGTQDKFAERLGIGRVSLSQRLNNLLEFTQKEILQACELLHIPIEQMPEYFFKEKVQKSEQNKVDGNKTK